MGGLIGLGNNPGRLALLGSVSELLCQLGDAAQLVNVGARDEVASSVPMSWNLRSTASSSSSLPGHPVVGAMASTTWAGIQFI